MVSSFIEKNNRILTITTIVLVVLASIIFGFKKQGFYIDEYYLYTVANGTQFGIAIEQGKWNDTSDYTKQLVSEGDENFSFKQVYHTESNGVHPPLYYYMLHFVSSVFAGRFSKWIGVSLNILILIPMLIVVHKMALKLSGGNQVVSLITVLLFGLSPATISMVMLVRMYLLLGFWTVLYVYLHVCDLERNSLSFKRFLLPVFITGFLGFLTQYFFVILMFFVTFVYAFYLMVFSRRVRDAIVYGTTALLALISTHLVWPFAHFHIFKGYRGTDAVTQLRDYHHIFDRIWLTFQWLDKLVFGHTTIVFIVLLIIGTVVLFKRIADQKKDGENNIIKSLPISTKGIIMIAIASLLNFFALSQVALLDGIECSRQFYTSYVLFLILIPIGVFQVFMFFWRGNVGRSTVMTACIVGTVLILGFVQKNVQFLYENERVLIEYARQHPDAKVVMFNNDDGNYDSRIQELMLYPRVYYVPVSDLSLAEDPIIASADELLVYISTAADPEDCFKEIYKQNSNITKSELLCNCYMFFDVYILR